MYCDPPECHLPTFQGNSSRPSDRHNWQSADLGETNYDYNEYGYFFTDCAVIEQCNELSSNQYTPSSGSDCYLDQAGQPCDTVSPSHYQSFGTANLHHTDLEPASQLAHSVLASQTPGLPQLGVDYEDTFPATFFMNPFAVSFPGDIAVPQDFDHGSAHFPDHWEGGAIPANGLYDYTASTDVDTRSKSSNPSPQVAAVSLDHGSQSSFPNIPVSTAHRLAEHSSNTPSPLLKVTHPTPSPTSTSTTPRQQTSSPKSAPMVSTPSTSAPSSGSGGFQFVDASDRKTITRLRNTIVSRKHRDNKVQRIKELERLLEERDREVEELKRKVAEGKK